MAEEKNEAVEQDGAAPEEKPIAAAVDESAIPPEQDEIDALRNAPEPVILRGVPFKVCAVPMDELPDLQAKLFELDALELKDGQVVPEEAIQVLADIAHYGLRQHHPHLTVERLKKMPIGCFPPLLMAILNLNDFFDGMKTVSAAGEAVLAARPASK